MRHIYYPSCNFQKLFPETAKRIRAYFETQPDISVAGCCHVTSDVPDPDDVIVTVCMSCMRCLDEVRPDVPQISLYELLLTRRDFPWPDLHGQVCTLQDCFRARGKHGLHDAVRECLTRMGVTFAEMPGNRDEETYDGSFLLHLPYPAGLKDAPRYFGEYLPEHLTPLPEAEWPEYLKQHARKYDTQPVVCYCNTCVTGARTGGAQAYHLAELLFPG